MARSYLWVMWDGGGNVGPFLCLAEHLQAAGHTVRAVAPAGLAERLAEAGVDLVGSPEGSLPGADDVVAAADAHPPDVVVVDYMLTDALGGAEQLGRPTVALVHTLYRELLADGAPHPIGMAGPVERLNPARVAAGLPPLASHADLLAAVDFVLVAAPRSLDAPGEVPANVVYAGPLLEGPGPDAGWAPPPGSGPLVVVSLGTVGDPAAEVPVLRRILAALAELPVRVFVTLADYVDPAAHRRRARERHRVGLCPARRRAAARGPARDPRRARLRRGRAGPRRADGGAAARPRAARQRPGPRPHGRRRRPGARRPGRRHPRRGGRAAPPLDVPRVTVDPSPAIARLISL